MSELTAAEQGGDAQRDRGLSRRTVLAGLGGAFGGAALGVGATLSGEQLSSSSAQPAAARPEQVAVYGANQAGIVRPDTPQPFGLVTVGDLDDRGDLGFLAPLGAAIAALVTRPPTGLLPDGPVSLSVTVGLGPRVVATHRSVGPGRQELPVFASDHGIDPTARGGDLLLAAYATDPNVLAPVVAHLAHLVPGYRARWSQRCFRGPGQGTIARNPLSFFDNIQVPRTADELAENVWLAQPFPGGTISVIRRLRLDVARFHRLSVPDRERVIGRHVDGSPLSGGSSFSPVNVDAKTPTGHYRIPAHAHVRAAHPSFTGSHLMLRRGYAYDNGGGDAGLMFMCFQKDLRTFVATQRRLDQIDDLMGFVTPTGSATFLILPGFTERAPLGDGLF